MGRSHSPAEESEAHLVDTRMQIRQSQAPPEGTGGAWAVSFIRNHSNLPGTIEIIHVQLLWFREKLLQQLNQNAREVHGTRRAPQECLVIKKTRAPLGPPKGPRHTGLTRAEGHTIEGHTP